MISEEKIRKEMTRVASGEVSLFEFAEWLDQNSWQDIGNMPSPLFRLVSSIDREFAEYDHHQDTAVLQRRLWALFNTAPIVLRFDNANQLAVVLRSTSASRAVDIFMSVNSGQVASEPRIIRAALSGLELVAQPLLA